MDRRHIGSNIEDFQLHDLLGVGGFARVYRAVSKITGDEVAIKVIRKSEMREKGMTSRVAQEVEIHSRLHHPAIVELYAYFEDAEYVYLVLELCHRGELSSILKKQNGRGFSEQETRYYMTQVLGGLLYLHSHRILHRDISLTNLLVTKHNHVKIGDFGLATVVNDSSHDEHFTICGTPNYISPEVVTRGGHGLTSDVWSVGCMLYTMIVGQSPFHSRGVKSTLNNVVSGKYQIPDHVSDSAKDLIKSLLQQAPKDRIPLEQISHHPFFSVPSERTSDFDTSIRSTLNQTKPVRINAPRLKPIRQKTRNSVLNILDNGEICLEYFKKVNEVEKVFTVIKISSCGDNISVFHPENGMGTVLTDQVTDLSSGTPSQEYSHTNLPSHLWKKYECATKFVNLVRSKTPKVTIHTDAAKCVLMENSEIEMKFTGGEKVCISKTSTVVTGSNGTKTTVNMNNRNMPTAMRQLLTCAEQYHHQLLHVESTLTQVEKVQNQSGIACFPVTIDKRVGCYRPENNTSVSSSDSGASECHSRSPSRRQSLCSSSNSDSSAGSQTPLCKVFVRGVGWGTQMSSGEIVISFIDGYELCVTSSPMTIHMTDPDDKVTSYGTSDQLPSAVAKRLEVLPVITSRLEEKQMLAN